MPCILKTSHGVDDDRMSQVQIRRSRVEPDLDAQGLYGAEAIGQLIDLDDFRSAADQLIDFAHESLLLI